jgi:ribosomal protein S14
MVNLNTISWIKKDKKNRILFLNLEIKKIILKSLLYNKKYPFFFKLYFDYKFKKFSYKSSIAKYRKYCMFLGNSRSIFQNFKLSRHILKKYASNGYIVGLKKSSF